MTAWATNSVLTLALLQSGWSLTPAPLREVRLKEMTMRRQFALLYRRDGYLSPAALRFVDLLMRKGQTLFAKG